MKKLALVVVILVTLVSCTANPVDNANEQNNNDSGVDLQAKDRGIQPPGK
jgi:uncharacterized protein YcfL